MTGQPEQSKSKRLLLFRTYSCPGLRPFSMISSPSPRSLIDSQRQPQGKLRRIPRRVRRGRGQDLADRRGGRQSQVERGVPRGVGSHRGRAQKTLPFRIAGWIGTVVGEKLESEGRVRRAGEGAGNVRGGSGR